MLKRLALLGAAHHTLLLIGWALLFSVLADGLRGVRLLGVAALFAVAVWLVNAHALPPLLRFGDGAGPPDLALTKEPCLIKVRLLSFGAINAARTQNIGRAAFRQRPQTGQSGFSRRTGSR